jgi:hypothetical protein
MGVLNYTTQNMTVQDTYLLSSVFGNVLPHGWSIVIVNFSAAALATSCTVQYIPINNVLA